MDGHPQHQPHPGGRRLRTVAIAGMKHQPNVITGEPDTDIGWMMHRLRYPLVAIMAIVLLAVATVIPVAIYKSIAGSGAASFEPENGSFSSSTLITKTTDSGASGGSYIKFSGTGACPAGQTGTPPNCTVPVNGTLPPGSTLPSDSTCNGRVVHKAENRPQNASYNATAGHNKGLPAPWLSRVTGAYTGTTDDILQWVACKWGIDPNVPRAEAVIESYWEQSTKGDFGNDASACPPNHGLGKDGQAGQCPQSYGILQVRYPYHGPPAGLDTWPEAETSTAYNADYMYSNWRSCYEGDETWLNTVERGEDYKAGDLWGCVGVWFSGRWKTADANWYIGVVQGYYNSKPWLNSGF